MQEGDRRLQLVWLRWRRPGGREDGLRLVDRAEVPQGAVLLVGYVTGGQVTVPVGTVLPVEQAAEAHRLLEARATTGKVVLRPWTERAPQQ